MEGDRVSISMDARIKGAQYGEVSQSNQEAARSASEYSTQFSEYASVSVAGELNEQEREDLGVALNIIDRMYQDFLGGCGDSAIARMNRFSALKTVAAVDTEFERQATIGGWAPEGVRNAIADLVTGEDQEGALAQLLGLLQEQTGIEDPDKLSAALEEKTALLQGRHTEGNDTAQV
jgi:hypothetical protein